VNWPWYCAKFALPITPTAGSDNQHMPPGPPSRGFDESALLLVEGGTEHRQFDRAAGGELFVTDASLSFV